jgi:hypothetical protein
VEDNITQCEEVISILRTAVSDFFALIDRIKVQEQYEKDRKSQHAIAWSLRKPSSSFSLPYMENVDLTAYLLSNITFGQVPHFGEQYSTNGLSWADVSDSSPNTSPKKSPQSQTLGSAHFNSVHNKLSSPHRVRQSPLDLKQKQEEKLAKAEWNRTSQQLQKQSKYMKENERMRDVAERREEKLAQKQKQTEEKLQQAHKNQIAVIKKTIETAKSESTKVKEVAFIRQMSTLNNEAILEKKLEDSAHRREQEKQKKIEKTAKDKINAQVAKQKREEIQAKRSQELEEQLKIKKEKEEKLLEEKSKQVQIRSNKNQEMLKKVKQINESKNLQVQQLKQSYERKMEAVAARKTLSVEIKRSKAKEELSKVREVIKRKESPIDVSPNVAASPRISTPTQEAEITDFRKANKKKIKKIRQKLLSLKKKLEGQEESTEISKYKNTKIKRLLQEIQTQLLNNKLELSTLQELNKVIGQKIQLQDFEYVKQEGGIDLLVQICTSESTKKQPSIRELSYQLLLHLTPENNHYLLSSLQILSLLQAFSDVLVLRDVSYVNHLLEIIIHGLSPVKDNTVLQQMREEAITFMILLGIPTDLVIVMRDRSNVLHVKLLQIIIQSPKSPHRETNLFGLTSMLTGLLLEGGRRPNQVLEIPTETIQIALETFKLLNDLSQTDLESVQIQLGDMFQAEVFHILSHILSHCCKEILDIVDKTEVGSKGRLTRELLDEIIVLIGHFTLQNTKNQEMVQYNNGRDPTLLQRLCTLPIQYFTDPYYKQILMPTLISVCYQNDTNKDLLEREMSTKMIVNFIKNYEEESSSDSRYSCAKRFPVELLNKASAFFDAM